MLSYSQHCLLDKLSSVVVVVVVVELKVYFENKIKNKKTLSSRKFKFIFGFIKFDDNNNNNNNSKEPGRVKLMGQR